MADDEVRRRELADFLRTRRARIAPQDRGIASGPRRRTGGLRREEVAALAGVSPSWYTKLEQGRDITISIRFLRSLADALKLSSAERSQLFELALLDPGLPALPVAHDTIPALQRMIDAMATSPAFIMTARGDYLGSNDAAKRVLGPYDSAPALEGNLLINLFLNRTVRPTLPTWIDSARYQVGVFRAAFGRNSTNSDFVNLVERLLRESSEFRAIWEEHEIQSESTRTLVFKHPRLGRIMFEYFTFYADIDTNLRIDIFTPLDVLDSKRKVAEAVGGAPAGL